MAQLLDSTLVMEDPCPYLHDRPACMEHRYLCGVSPEETEALLIRGWRRFGLLYFRPVCEACTECVSLRIPVADFSPGKTQRRVWRKGAAFEVTVGAPQVDDERLALFHRWHMMHTERRGWPMTDTSEESYRWSFVQSHPCAREMCYRIDGKLVAVGLVDLTPSALSSTYFYYAPEIDDFSPGTFSILCEIEYARSVGRAHVYLGYRVAGCPSVAYKDRFRPHEILVGRPEIHHQPVWTPSGA